MSKMEQALSAWNSIGEVQSAEHFGNGHINDTYLVQTKNQKRYILQRINTRTFQDVEGLMENIHLVTGHISRKVAQTGGDVQRESMSLIPSDRGLWYHKDNQGDCWRMFTYIEDSICLQKARNEQDLYECAAAFGKFQRQLEDFDAEQLSETIPHFHDTPKRLRDFEQAVQQDLLGRAQSVQREIEFVRSRKEDCAVMVGMLADGKLPLRVTHNDTKLNNVLLDSTTMQGLCVIDLDTVMPGLAANDFGDTVRFGANDCREDEQDQSRVHFLLPLYQVCVQGFLSQAGPALTEQEILTLPWGARLMTLECGIRFLTDYLQGDTYFKLGAGAAQPGPCPHPVYPGGADGTAVAADACLLRAISEPTVRPDKVKRGEKGRSFYEVRSDYLLSAV